MIYLQYENFVFNLVFLIWCFNSYSQNITQQERTVYSTFSLYEQDSALKMVCRVAKRKIEEVYYLNVKNKSDSVVAIWGIKFEDKVWVKNRRKNKYYELKKDSVGVYYDLYNSERNSMGTGGPGGIIVYRFKNKNGISTELIGNTVIRYRMDSESGKFFPFDYPLLPKTKMVYYFSKYSKNETPITIKIDEKSVVLMKGSYFEDSLPIREDYAKGIDCLGDNIHINVKSERTKTGVILFKRKKDGTLTYDQLNENMVSDFLIRKEKLEKVNP